MSKRFTNTGTPERPIWHITLRHKNGEVAINVEADEVDRYKQLEQITDSLKLHCRLGRAACGANTDWDFNEDLEARPVASCSVEDCHFGLYGFDDGGSGDREPRQPIRPADMISVEV